MSNADDNAPATRGDLRELRTELRSEIGQLRSELRSEIGQLRTELHSEIGPLRQAVAVNAAAIADNKAAILSLRHELLLEIGAAASRTANVVIEQMRDLFGVLDDRYRDLPGRVTSLETQLQQHVGDDKRHV